MSKILAEDKFGHGAIQQFKFITRIRRALRPKADKLGKASIPFDWSKGAGIRVKIGGKLPINNQGQEDSCGGQAGERLLEIKGAIKGKVERLSAKSVYAPIAYSGGGTTVNSLENQVANKGANTELAVPSYDAYGNPLSESQVTELSWVTPSTMADAMTRAGYIPITVNVDIDSVASAIRDYGAVIMKITGVNNNTWLSSNPRPPTLIYSPSTPNTWRHFMCSDDVQPIQNTNGVKQVDFYQSWGKGVGNQGIQSFTEDYFKSGYISDVFAFDTKQKIVTPDPVTLQKINIIQHMLVLLQQLKQMLYA